MNRFTFLLFGSVSAVACSSGGKSACADGTGGCACYGNDTCDESLVCNSHSVCVARDGGGTDADEGDSGGPSGSGASEDDSSPFETCEQFPASLTDDTTISAGCYAVTNVPSMAEGVDVTLSAGVTLVFADGIWFEIGEFGSLRTLGTSQEPVVFTSANEQAGSWGGVLVPYGSIELNHTIVEYAGAEIPGTDRMACVPDVAAGVRLGQGDYVSVLNSTFRNNRGAGAAFDVSECYYGVEFDENTLTGNDLPLVTTADAVGQLGTGNSFGGNAKEYIQLLHDGLYEASSWVDLGAPIFALQGLTVESSLVLNAGVTVQFTPDTTLVVEGSLLALGTEEHPVVLESAQVGEAWKGVECVGSGYADFASTMFVDAMATECVERGSE